MQPNLHLALLLLEALATLWIIISTLLGIHEAGHLIAMKAMGVKADQVVIGSVKIVKIKISFGYLLLGAIPLWGFVQSKAYEDASLSVRALIAVAGPLASLITGLGFTTAYLASDFWLLKVLAEGSFLLTVTNMIPLPPFDGWTITEFGLSKFQIYVSAKQRRILLSLGLISAVLLCFISH